MESDLHRRGPPPHESSASSTLPTLPSVAELLASSRPTTDSFPAYHHPSSKPPQHVSRSTTPYAPAVSTPANASSSSEHSYLVAVGHASQASPTESATSTSHSEPQHYRQLAAQLAAAPFTPASTSEAPKSLDSAYAQPPMNARRQDSGISQHHIETSKEGLTFALSPNSNLLYSRRSPDDSYHSVSPRLGSYPISQPSLPSTHHSAADPRSHEHVQSRPGTESASRIVIPSLPPDHTNNSNTRQQRYNVRFAANHTPANMPAAQRPRQSPPPPTAPTPTETPDTPPALHDEHVAPTIEPAIQAITRSFHQSDEQSQPEVRSRELSVERCSGCNEIWSRPLFSPLTLDHSTSNESTNEIATANAGFASIVVQLQKHSKDADAQYLRWMAYHKDCSRNAHRDPGPSSYSAASLRPSHSIAPNGQSHTNGHFEATSNKRRSEASHGNSPKMRKVTFDADTSAPPVRPSALT